MDSPSQLPPLLSESNKSPGSNLMDQGSDTLGTPCGKHNHPDHDHHPVKRIPSPPRELDGDRKRLRMAIDALVRENGLTTEEIKAKSTSKMRPCNRCRSLKVKCTGVDQGFPCKRCVNGSHECTFQELNRGKRSSKKHEHPMISIFRPPAPPPQTPHVSRAPPTPNLHLLSDWTPARSSGLSPSYNWHLPDWTPARSSDLSPSYNWDFAALFKPLSMESTDSLALYDTMNSNSYGGTGAASESTNYSTREGARTTLIEILRDDRKHVKKGPYDESHRPLLLNLLQPRMIDTLPGRLQGKEAQTVVDFLSDTLHCSDILLPDERKRALHLLCKIAKSAQVFPKAIILADVECDLGCAVNEGGFGVIYKGMFRGAAVCVKAVRMYQVGAKKRALRAHAGELALGAHVLHPNVLPLYGAFISNEPTPRICIASPWMEGGSLVEYLHSNPDVPRIPLVSDILHGIQHLHGIHIVHADLKASNVLVSKAQRAVLADFGISRIAMTNVGTTTSADATGTTNWMAPELLTADEVPPATRESDIWAFGCVCYEVLTGKIPFAQYKNIQLIRAFDSGKAVLTRPDPTPNILYADEIWSLAQMCLRYNPSERATVDEGLKFVIELNVEDQRPAVSADTKIFNVERPRSGVQIDYDILASIVTRVQTTEKAESSLISPS